MNTRHPCLICCRYCMSEQKTAKTQLLEGKCAVRVVCEECVECVTEDGKCVVCGIEIYKIEQDGTRGDINRHAPSCDVLMNECPKCHGLSRERGRQYCSLCTREHLRVVHAEMNKETPPSSYRQSGGPGSANPRWGGDPEARP